MTLKDWKEFKQNLTQHYPNWEIGSAITDAALKLGTTVREEIK